MKRAIIYCRSSSYDDIQNQESIGMQKRACATYSVMHGLKVIGIFCDAGSKTSLFKRRRELERAFLRIAEGGVDYLLMTDIERMCQEKHLPTLQSILEWNSCVANPVGDWMAFSRPDLMPQAAKILKEFEEGWLPEAD